MPQQQTQGFFEAPYRLHPPAPAPQAAGADDDEEILVAIHSDVQSAKSPSAQERESRRLARTSKEKAAGAAWA